jgi:hypothetical protein
MVNKIDQVAFGYEMPHIPVVTVTAEPIIRVLFQF